MFRKLVEVASFIPSWRACLDHKLTSGEWRALPCYLILDLKNGNCVTNQLATFIREPFSSWAKRVSHHPAREAWLSPKNQEQELHSRSQEELIFDEALAKAENAREYYERHGRKLDAAFALLKSPEFTAAFDRLVVSQTYIHAFKTPSFVQLPGLERGLLYGPSLFEYDPALSDLEATLLIQRLYDLDHQA